MSTKTTTPLIPAAMTPEQVRATQERRRSGAAGTHRDKRDRRNRTRAARKARALRDW